MKISIILSVTNVDDILFDTINNIYSHSNVELIICISELLKQQDILVINNYLKKYSNENIFKVKGCSLEYCKNKAINMSRGEYLFFLNSYENINVDMLFQCYIECKAYYLDILSFDYSILNKYREWSETSSYLGDKVSLISIDKYIDKTIMKSSEFYLRLIKNNIYTLNLSNYLIKRFYILKNKIKFDEYIYSQDDLFTLKILISNGILRYKPINCLLKYDRNFFENNKLIINKSLNDIDIKNYKYIDLGCVKTTINTFKIILEYLFDLKINIDYLNYTLEYILDRCMKLIKLVKDKEVHFIINRFLLDLNRYISRRDDIGNTIKINLDMILHAPTLYNRKNIELIYDFIHHEYTNIIKITNLLDNIKNKPNLFYNYISKINSIIYSNKLFDKFYIVDKINNIEKTNKAVSISIINKHVKILIDNLYYDIEPDIENYRYMENKFKYILNNLNRGI